MNRPAPFRPRTQHVLIAAGLALALILYPLALPELLGSLGVRWIAGLGIAGLGLGFWLRHRFGNRRPGMQPGVLGLIAPLSLSLAALLSGDRSYLLLIPAALNLVLFFFVIASLQKDPCLIEQAARTIQPHLPDFVRGYCRIVTGLWAGFFLSYGAGIGILAVSGDVENWRFITGPLYLGLITFLCGIEFLIRKSHFRHYTNRWWDRLFSRLMPAENTIRGRRSARYIADFEASLAEDPPSGNRRRVAS